MNIKKQILELLERDSTLTAEQIASMVNADLGAVEAIIKECEDAGIIVGHRAVIDWDKTDFEAATALIEIKVTPQRGQGFERIAQRICQYSEVESVYLMSGGFDITAIIKGKTLKEVALFVAEKLAPLDAVTATSTHFVLQKFKEAGVFFKKDEEQQERMTAL